MVLLPTAYDLVNQLTSAIVPLEQRGELIAAFAEEFRWQPSEAIPGGPVALLSNGHLLVEHGLENTAAITFLKHPTRYGDLDRQSRLELLGLSYNSLLDWHVHVQSDCVTYVHNRASQPGGVLSRPISRGSTDALMSDEFLSIAASPPPTSMPALDEALIEMISYWKRRLAAELGYEIENRKLSELFNFLILLRAVEDQQSTEQGWADAGQHGRILLSEWKTDAHENLRQLVASCLQRYQDVRIPAAYDPSALDVFDHLSRRAVSSLLSDFYQDRRVPYSYNFAVMSKHALSRIYEHYVSLLSLDDSDQLSLFPQLPEEERNRAFGSVYTPQFIARFFSKLVKRELTEAQLRDADILDPACGSGIFLHSLLEEARLPISAATGIDYDGNACQATRLSLSLLAFSREGRFPENLKVFEEESLGYFETHAEMHSEFDVVLMNPPFVSIERLGQRRRAIASAFLGDLRHGRVDAYLPFLKLAVDALRPNGVALVVLPHSFLLADNARKVRQFVSTECEVICIADLSAIRVFGKTGSYVVLLCLRKRGAILGGDSPATVVLCQDLPSRALGDALAGKAHSTPSYSVFHEAQSVFNAERWVLLPPKERAIRQRFRHLPALEEFLEIHQGFVSGADDIFIRAIAEVPLSDRELYVSHLPDRDMEKYKIPSTTEQVFFYPFKNGQKVTAEEIESSHPETWTYLNAHRKRLLGRSGLERYRKQWWEPMWPRMPSSMMRPKIITPHLTLTARFSLDSDGKYAVTRVPMLYPVESMRDDEMGVLKFFLGVLNSLPCFWSIALNSHVYRGGYLMLERKTLLSTPVPDPREVGSRLVRKMIGLVEERIRQTETNHALDMEIDELSAKLYGLSLDDLQALGYRAE